MGTRGFYAYRYQGRYYKKYNHWDSYPSELGARLMSYVPEDPEEFKRWLEKARAIIASFDEEEYDEEEEEDHADDESHQVDGTSDSDSSDFHQQFYQGLHRKAFEFSNEPPENDLFIEWTYVYDLDNLAFTIQGGVHFRLDNLPRGRDADGTLWIERYIYCDQLHAKCRAPFMPAEYCARMVPLKPLSDSELENIQHFEASKVQKIDSSTWMDSQADGVLSLWKKLAAVAAEGLISALFSRFASAYANFDEVWFETFAKELLTCACPGSAEFSGDDKVTQQWSSELLAKRDDDTDEDLGIYFWFRDCLVALTSELDQPDRFKSAVGKAILFASDLGECTIILWSIDHVAVVVITKEGVSCSDPIGVVSAFGRDDAEFKRGLGLIAHYLPPPCVPDNPTFESRLALDNFIRIMAFADVKSAAMLGQTSKALRLEWLKRPAVGPYTLLSAQDDQYFIARAQENGDVGSPVKLLLRFPNCMSYDEFCSYVVFSEVNPSNDKNYDRVMYGSGTTLPVGEIEEVTHGVYLRARFINLEYKSLCSWRLVAIKTKSKP